MSNSFDFHRPIASFVLIAATLIACSSGGSGSTGSTGSTLGGTNKSASCKNTKLRQESSSDDVCNQCDANHCAAQGNTVIGSDSNAFGGACGEVLQCICDCDASDASCLSLCSGKSTQACKDASAASLACEKEHCSKECAKDGG